VAIYAKELIVIDEKPPKKNSPINCRQLLGDLSTLQLPNENLKLYQAAQFNPELCCGAMPFRCAHGISHNMNSLFVSRL
jgi:hypothetical protein